MAGPANKSCDIKKQHVHVLFTAQKQKNTGKKVDIVAMATGWGCKSTPSSSTPSTMRSVGKSSWSQLVSDCPSDMDMRLKPPIYQSRAQKMLHMSLEVCLCVCVCVQF